MVRDSKLYDILGVNSNADLKDITKAFKKLAREYHPDKNKGDEAKSAKFLEMNEAYNILSDKEKRNMYDQLGMDFVNKGSNSANNSNMFSGFPFSGHGIPFPSHGVPFSGIPFPSHGVPFPANGMPFPVNGMPFPVNGVPFPVNGMHSNQNKENIVLDKEVSLDEIYNESNISIEFKQKHFCSHCNNETTSCTVCNGMGMRIQITQTGHMIQQMQIPCSICNSTGKIKNKSNCSHCDSNGYNLKKVNISIPLKKSLTNDQHIQIPQQGHQFKNEKTDLIIKIIEKPHSIFKRNNNNLLIDIELKLYQAIYGFTKIIEHMDKRKLYISHECNNNNIIENGMKKRIKGEGMTNEGDLIITFLIKMPLLDNIELSNRLMFLLKNLDNEESNNECIIKKNKSKYIYRELI
jgi:DnaJ family protein A protein 2